MYLITTTSHGGRKWYLRPRMSATTKRESAARYASLRAAENALVRKRLASEIDSAWQHGIVITLDQ